MELVLENVTQLRGASASTMNEANPLNEDAELIARTQAGDTAAFDRLVVKYSPRLYGLVQHDLQP